MPAAIRKKAMMSLVSGNQCMLFKNHSTPKIISSSGKNSEVCFMV